MALRKAPFGLTGGGLAGNGVRLVRTFYSPVNGGDDGEPGSDRETNPLSIGKLPYHGLTFQRTFEFHFTFGPDISALEGI